MRILIVGGYGVFGGRLARLLDDEPRLTLLIAGRSAASAAAFIARSLPGPATKVAQVFDRAGDTAAQLGAAAPDLVVDASGPFQAYGDGRPYALVEACLAAGIDYCDLADGSDFVAGIGRLDAAAKALGRFALSGASSFPVLTAAVVRHLGSDLAAIETVRAGIAPSPYAGVGSNVIRAIASYAGRPVRLRRDGEDAFGHALAETLRFTIAPPGRLPLQNIRFSLVDVPDLQVLPGLWPQLRTVWVGAGPVPEILHRALNALAGLVRRGVLPSLLPFAPLFHVATNRLRWGEHRGGMFVAVEGTRADGRPVERSWHLLAEGDDGPLIPAMAVEAVVRRMLSGRPPAPGARSAALELDLADYDALFARRTIVTGFREEPCDGLGDGSPLYPRLLGAAWGRLPAPIRAVHEWRGAARAVGRADVERGRSPLAHLAARLFGFPPAGRDVPLEVSFREEGGVEIWRRCFAGRSFESRQSAGTGRSSRLLTEAFGPFAFDLALVVEGERLRFVLRRWRAFGLPLPRALAPGGEAYEAAEDGRFRFHVDIRLPLIGRIVQYQGWLALRDAENGPSALRRAAVAREELGP